MNYSIFETKLDRVLTDAFEWPIWDERLGKLEKILNQAEQEGRWETIKSAMHKMGFKYDRLPRKWRDALRRRGGWSEQTKAYLERLKRNISHTRNWSEVIDQIENTYREAYKNNTPMKRVDILKQNGVNLINSSGNPTPMPRAMQSELHKRGGWAPDVLKIMAEWGHRDRYRKPGWNMITQEIVDVLQMAAQDNTPISIPDILELVGLKRNTRFPAQVVMAMKKRGGWPPEVAYIKREDTRKGRPFNLTPTNADPERSDPERSGATDYYWGSWEESWHRS